MLNDDSSKIDMTDRRNWKPIDAQTILEAPIKDIGEKLFVEEDNQSYAIDGDGRWWVCGWFMGSFCRVEAWPNSPDIEEGD